MKNCFLSNFSCTLLLWDAEILAFSMHSGYAVSKIVARLLTEEEMHADNQKALAW
jgi:hypothetical protein